MQKKLIEILDSFIEYNYNLKDKYNEYICKRDMLKELFSLLDNDYDTIMNHRICISILLDTLYNGKSPYNFFYNALLKYKNGQGSMAEVNLVISKVKDDYSKIESDIKKIYNEIISNTVLIFSARRVKFCFKEKIPIKDKKDIKNIKEIISLYGEKSSKQINSNIKLSKKELVLLINEIEYYNRLLANKNASQEAKDYANELYNEVPSVLNAGYESFENIDVQTDRKPILDKKVIEISKMISTNDGDKMIEILNNYSSFYSNINEYNYILIKLLRKSQDDLFTNYELLTDNDCFNKYSQKKQIVRDYYEELNKYLQLRKYYDEYNTFTTNIDENNEEDTAETISDQEPKKIIFSHSNIDPSRVKVIDDMDDIPEEYYGDIIHLIEKFLNGKLTRKEIKPLINNKKLSKYKELRDEQIRILFIHIRDNIYCISGITVKKDNNDINMYRRMANRMIPDVSTDEKLERELKLGKITLSELKKIVDSKSRKGNR